MVVQANPGASFAPENMPTVILGEIVPVLLEATMIRLLFDIKYLKSLLISLLANVVSFVSTMKFGIQFSEKVLGEISDIIYGTSPNGGSIDSVFDPWFLELLVFGCIWAVIVETPIYILCLYNSERKYKGSMWGIPLFNLISYPIYFFLVWLAVVLRWRIF